MAKVHFRRCHVCGQVNEGSGSLVTTCSDCGKHLNPFYYFNECKILDYPSDKHEQAYFSNALPLKEYPPIIGLTVYWES